jgi:hypothetical protein
MKVIIGQQCIVKGNGGQQYLGRVVGVEPDSIPGTSRIKVEAGTMSATYDAHNVELIDPRVELLLPVPPPSKAAATATALISVTPDAYKGVGMPSQKPSRPIPGKLDRGIAKAVPPIALVDLGKTYE